MYPLMLCKLHYTFHISLRVGQTNTQAKKYAIVIHESKISHSHGRNKDQEDNTYADHYTCMCLKIFYSILLTSNYGYKSMRSKMG